MTEIDLAIEGWIRTVLLGLGGLIGVILTAEVIHLLKMWGWIK